MKIVTIIGTRPEIIRLSCVIKKLDKFFEHIIIHTGQNWDHNLCDVFFNELGLRKPDYFLNIVGKHLGESMGNIISKSYELLQSIKPDAILILGDTNSALSAISAKRLKIPIFHMEAGNRCFDLMVPEEINRKIVDTISDINLPYTEHGRRNLIVEGFKSDQIIVTGSPLREVYEYYNENISSSKILEKLNVEKNTYILWSTHREENIDIDLNFNKTIKNINAVAEKYKHLKLVMSLHPRTRKKIDENKITFNENVILHEPFGLFDYILLQKNAYCVISDSGTISEESVILNVPAVNYRCCTERPEAIDKGNIIFSGLDTNNLLDAIDITVESKNHNVCPTDYVDTNISDKIVNIIISYVPFINNNTWKKNVYNIDK
ncbi:UDP-N-acetylglucosamine2-epimerase [Moumouvirus australiensis]|uniref:UDP-N-acetylglucosamine2-epimerase n=1 Tax=Moumouvirus australiensis TaxID=2109587 RepID=A0A2P1ELS7_9VIRU|nr:UDP-N-acetylglucosamine2-epimerase [Moumouvirus australiensis]AVL94846.1 UDP-N-acetylglucosamine2-epimerase [Moumouvirus australiensis]